MDFSGRTRRLPPAPTGRHLQPGDRVHLHDVRRGTAGMAGTFAALDRAIRRNTHFDRPAWGAPGKPPEKDAHGVPDDLPVGRTPAVERVERRQHRTGIWVRTGHVGTIQSVFAGRQQRPAFRTPLWTRHSLLRCTMQGERHSDAPTWGSAGGRDRRAVDVTRHRRALLLRASVVAMLVAGAVAAFGTPAFAAPEVQIAITSGNPVTLQVGGGTKQLIVQVKNTGNPEAPGVKISIDVPLDEMQVTIGDPVPNGCVRTGNHLACDVGTLAPDGANPWSRTVQIKPPASSSLRPGQETPPAQGTINIESGGSGTKTFNVTLRGPSASPVVPEVSGTVIDSTTAAPIRDAEVTLTDGAGAHHKRGSDANGRFKFTSTSSDPIAPGSLSIIASKDGFEGIQKNVEGRAGQSLVNQRIQLKPVAATASAEPPTTAPTDTAAPTSGDTAPAAASGNGSGTGLFSWVLIGLGALLVLLGIGAIVLLLVRRKDDEPDDEPDDGRGRRGPSPVPAARGMYVGAPGADPTMVAGRGGPGDATAMIRPPRPGGYPDPYAASPQPAYPPTSGQGPAGYSGSGGYGASGGYGGGPTRPASPAGYPASPAGYPASPAGYGSGGAGGYSGDPRGGYDEPTDRYSGAGGGHAAPPGYGQSGGYDAGYDRGSGGYDRRPDHEAGYDRGGPPYDRVPEEREGYRSDYGTSDGYYDDPAAAPSRRTSPSSRADRRSLDWLDD